MNYFNIHTDDLRRQEFVLCEPVTQATWFKLMAWCLSQENSGRIADAASWGDRAWMQLCGVTKEEVRIENDLYKFDGEDLVISFYPIEKQTEVQTARENGKKGGRPSKKGGNPETAPKETPNKPTINPEVIPDNNPAETIKEEEGNSKREEEGNSAPEAAPSPSTDSEVMDDRGGNPNVPQAKAIIDRMNPDWTRFSSQWSPEEERELWGSLEYVLGLTDSAVQAIADYIKSPSDKFHLKYFTSRRIFISKLGEIVSAAGAAAKAKENEGTHKEGGRKGTDINSDDVDPDSIPDVDEFE